MEGSVVTPIIVTKEMLSPLTSSINSNMEVLLPIGIGLMSVMIGVGLIPRIIYKFL